MNSPSLAFVWEIWRKNRWGFTLLLVLLVVCVGVSRLAVHVRNEAARLEAAQPTGATLPSSFVLQSSPGAPAAVPAQRVQFKLGPNVVYEGMFSVPDRIYWSTIPGKGDWLVLTIVTKTLEMKPLFDGPAPADLTLSWTRADGVKGSVALNFVPGFSVEVADAKARAESWREAVLGWSATLMSFSFFALFGIFGCAEPHSRRGFTGIPPRRFTLPVRTSLLVGWPIALGCATILAIYFTWSRLVFHFLLPAQEKMPDLYLALLLPAGLVMFQAIVWGLASFPKARVCLITILLLTLFPLGGLPFGMMTVSGDDVARWSALEPKLLAAFPLVWVLGVVLAWAGARQERRGGWSGWRGPEALERFVRAVRPRPSEFRSALRAQFWIEWRRNARLALGVLVVLAVGIVGFAFFLVFDPPRFKAASVELFPLALLVIPVWLAWLAIAGLNFARDGSSKQLAFSSFSATRPLSTGTLLTAKLLAGAALWTCALVVFALVAVSLVVLNDDFRGLPNLIEWIAVVTVSGHIFVGILPLCLSGRIPGFPWSLLPLLLVYGLVVNALSYFGHHQEFYSPLSVSLILLLLLKLAVAFWGFRRALGLKWVSPRFVAGYAALWLAGSGVLVWLAQESIARADWAPDLMPFLPAAALVLPLARIALSPLALAMNRHR